MAFYNLTSWFVLDWPHQGCNGDFLVVFDFWRWWFCFGFLQKLLQNRIKSHFFLAFGAEIPFGAEISCASSFFMELKRIAKRLKESRRVGAGFRKNWEEKSWEKVTRFGKSWKELREGEKRWEEEKRGDMKRVGRIEESWHELRRGDKSSEELRILRRIEKSWEELIRGVDKGWRVEKNTGAESRSGERRWEGLSYGGRRLQKLRTVENRWAEWEGLRRAEVSWEELRRDNKE